MSDNEVKLSREHLKALEKDEEEKPYDREEQAIEEVLEECSGKGESQNV